MQAIVFDAPGGPEVLRLAEQPDPVPRAGELLVRVRAAGVNRADLLQRLGKYPPPPGASALLGLELAGEVIGLGRGCERFAVGARVMALVTGGAYAALATVPETMALPIPDGLDWSAAAAVPEAFLTAYLNLFDLGGLERGEWVLVHAGASGVGTAAIQLAHETGARVVTTAGTEAKLELCRSLGADVTLDRRREDFAAASIAATGGEGVHLVIDCVGAPYWEANLRALRPRGRLVLVGFLAGSKAELDLGPVMRKSLVVRGTTLRAMAAESKADLVARCGAFILPRLANGRLRPVVDRVFPLADAPAAHIFMAESGNAGKLVLEVE